MEPLACSLLFLDSGVCNAYHLLFYGEARFCHACLLVFLDDDFQMLKSFKVEKLVISAIPGLVETWTCGFGFEPLEDCEKRSLSHVNLMVFPGTVWLKKSLFQVTDADQPSGEYLVFDVLQL